MTRVASRFSSTPKKTTEPFCRSLGCQKTFRIALSFCARVEVMARNVKAKQQTRLRKRITTFSRKNRHRFDAAEREVTANEKPHLGQRPQRWGIRVLPAAR